MPGLSHAVVKQAEKFRVQELVKKIESHPYRESLQTDLQQNNVYNPFSNNSKAMISEMVQCRVIRGVRNNTERMERFNSGESKFIFRVNFPKFLIGLTIDGKHAWQQEFFQHIYHIGCAFNLHSVINNGLIPGGQNSSKRQTVFFSFCLLIPETKAIKILQRLT